MRQSAQVILRRRLTTAIALPIVLLLLLSSISIWQVNSLRSALQWVDHTDRVISQANRVQKLLVDMETGNRGYLLTGEQTFLEPYTQAIVQIKPALNVLQQLVDDNPNQVQRVKELQQRHVNWIRGVPNLVLAQSNQAELRATLLRRKQEMDAMRSLIAGFIATEEQLRSDRVRTVQQISRFVTATSVGLAFIIGGVLAYVSWRQLRKVAQTYTRMLESLQQSLDDRNAAEERFRRAILEAPLPIMLHTETGEVIQINRQWVKITGYTLQDIPTIADWTERAYGERRNLVRAEIDRLYDLKESLAEGEFVVTTRAGEKRTWEFFSSPVGTLADRRRLIISTAIDITDRKHIEQQFQENYTLLQSVINGTTDAIFMKDRQGCYRLANQRTAQILGQSVENILGKNDTQFLPPDVVTALQDVDRTVMRTGRSQIFEEQIPENGEIRTFLSTKDPYVDAQGNIAGIIGIARDITDRKQAEEQIQKAAKRLAALQEIDRSILRLESPAEIAQAAISRLLQVVEADQAAVLLFNLERGEFEILAGEIGGDRVGTVRQIADSVSLDVLLNREAVWYIQDLAMLVQRSAFGEKLLAAGYHSFLAVALIVAGNFTGDLLLVKREPNAFSAEDREIVHEVANQLAIAIQQSQLRDQLQRYATELEHRVAERTAELEVTNQELEAFTYSVSHDLRAPLRTIQGFAQALLEDYDDQLDELGKNYIHSIIEDSMQMNGLIADLLAYSRLSRTQINPQLVDLNAGIKEALKQVATEVQETRASITIAEPLPSVLAHRATLIQVLANLLSNALKFVELGTQPRVNIYTKEEQRDRQTWVKLYIEDNGIGIAPEHQERIFRVFERLHGAETYPGTGIGLAIVRKGLERMGGDAGVESQLGHGSRFWIALPKVLTHSTTHDDSAATD